MTVYRSKSLIGTGMAIYKYTGSDDPLTDPESHLTELLFHSSFNYFAAAPDFPTTVTIDHDEIDPDAGTTVGPVTSYKDVVETDYEIVTHDLGYVPDFMVSANGVEWPSGCPIQIAGYGARRCITFWADTSKIYVRDSSKPSLAGLPAISVDYGVVVFRDPGDVAGAPLYGASASRVQLGYGRIDSDEATLREVISGETPYALPSGETMSIINGRFRHVPGNGQIVDIGPIMGPGIYDGAFYGGPSKQVTI